MGVKPSVIRTGTSASNSVRLKVRLRYVASCRARELITSHQDFIVLFLFVILFHSKGFLCLARLIRVYIGFELITMHYRYRFVYDTYATIYPFVSLIRCTTNYATQHIIL